MSVHFRVRIYTASDKLLLKTDGNHLYRRKQYKEAEQVEFLHILFIKFYKRASAVKAMKPSTFFAGMLT